jgi:hypothetical protein
MTWDDRYFPNPAAMQEDIASRGRKMVGGPARAAGLEGACGLCWGVRSAQCQGGLLALGRRLPAPTRRGRAARPAPLHCTHRPAPIL